MSHLRDKKEIINRREYVKLRASIIRSSHLRQQHTNTSGKKGFNVQDLQNIQ